MDLIRTAISRPVTVSMFVVAVILFGVVSLDRLALNLLPSISYPSLTVQTDYPDSAPEEVENLITRPIEGAVGVVSGLTRLSSVSRAGQSEVILEFGWDTDMNLAALDVREKLGFVTLPRDAEKPIILRFDPTYDPIMRLRLRGNMSPTRLRYLADRDLKKALEATEGVAAVKVIGGVEEQIHVEIDEKRLAELGIPITDVSQVLAQENLNQAAGSLYDLDANYLVRMLNQFRSVEEIQGIIVRSEQGRRTVLGDVAKVWRGARERTIIARLNGEDSVEVAVYKEGDANTVTVSRAVQEKLSWLKGTDFWPPEAESQIVFNQAEFIEHSVQNVLSAAMLGGLLATVILFVFLRDLRSTLTIAFSIPISIMATFALMYQTDITLNIMSLGGVALGVGMLVDNSIVVLESVHRHRKTSRSLAESVLQGTREVGMAVTASTLTTVAVFIPLVFVEGIAGQLFRDQALTITYSLLASLLVALTFIPMIQALRMEKKLVAEPPVERRPRDRGEAEALTGGTTHDFKSRVGEALAAVSRLVRSVFRFLFVELPTVVLGDSRKLLRGLGRVLMKGLDPLLLRFESFFNRLSEAYPGFLRWSLDNKVLVVGFAFVMVSLTALMALQLGTELIPPLTQGEFSFEIQLPEGAPIEETDRILREIERTAGAFPQVATVFSSVGGSTQNQFSRDAEKENEGQLYVVMKDKRDRAAEEAAIRQIRDELSRYPDLIYTFNRPTLFSFKSPIEVEIYAFDLGVLQSTAEQLARRMQTTSGLSDITTSTEMGNPEIRVRFHRERLARLGLDETAISNILRNKIRGDVATRYREEDRQIDILVRADETDRRTLEDLGNLVINSPANLSGTEPREGASTEGLNEPGREGIPIRLAAVADISIGRGPSEIRRIRSQRAAVVSANLSGRPLSAVSEEIQSLLSEVRQQSSPDTNITLAGQNEELATSQKSLLFALVLAVFLVYLVMASQFESLVHPFIILFTVPLGLIGVVFALFVTATTISVMVLLGVIVLCGIVVNNAIVLVDYTNQLRRQGQTVREALMTAGRVRLRPIVMTTLTTVLGLIPMSLSWGEGAEIRAPLAITVIGGLLFSTLLTLIFIPVVYELVNHAGIVLDPAFSRRLLSKPQEGTQPGLPAAAGD